jgi:hypothetical protein
MNKLSTYHRYLWPIFGLVVLILAGCEGGGKDQPSDSSTQASFVGANSCSQCHTTTFENWRQTDHAAALTNLPSSDQSNSVCLICHNTTQNPLEGVQCEACHGAGGLHWGLGPIDDVSYQDTLCRTCHDNDSALSTSHLDTHVQWSLSEHADELAAPWHEFSDEAPPPARHLSVYPIAMSNSSDGNFVCFQCHNGIGALSYIKNTILTPAAITVEENATAECTTCHDPHQATATRTVPAVTTTKHVRLPEAISFNTSLASVNRVFKFLDNSDIPATIGNSIICVYCHQGRSSGLVLNSSKFGLAADASGRRFENDHYLAAGAILWGRNGYEYTGRSYTRSVTHNTNTANGNCTGCHMDNANTGTEGGHTWKMVSDAGVQNVAACNVSGCHDGGAAGGPVTDFRTFTLNSVDYDGDGTAEGFAEELGGFVLDSNSAPEDGLLGALHTGLKNAGFLYNANRYPYFFKADGSSTTPSDWTNVNLAAAFNLNMLVKTVKQFSAVGTTGNFKGGTNTHNPYYSVQLLVDSLESIGAATATQLANRPNNPVAVADEAARSYGANQLSLP